MSNETKPNAQPTGELSMFQKVILQHKYITQLNLWIDELDWEMEKAKTIIEQREMEIESWKKSYQKLEAKYKSDMEQKKRKIESMGKRITAEHNMSVITKNDRMKVLKVAANEVKQNREVKKLKTHLHDAVLIAELLYQELQNHGIKTNIKIDYGTKN